jgi:hypothetical protein
VFDRKGHKLWSKEVIKEVKKILDNMSTDDLVWLLIKSGYLCLENLNRMEI